MALKVIKQQHSYKLFQYSISKKCQNFFPFHIGNAIFTDICLIIVRTSVMVIFKGFILLFDIVCQ